MSKVRDGNYYVVQSFMVKELALKGLEKDVYALIYGFTQAEDLWFDGSLQYLVDWTNSTKQGVLKVLNSLIEKGLIEKQDNTFNGVKFVKYRSTKFNGGIQLSLTGGIKLSLPNNIDNNNINNNIVKEKNIIKKKNVFTPPTYEEVLEYATTRNMAGLAKTFFEYFETGNWVDSLGKPVVNWKQKFITWEKNNKKGDKKVGEPKRYDGSMYADL